MKAIVLYCRAYVICVLNIGLLHFHFLYKILVSLLLTSLLLEILYATNFLIENDFCSNPEIDVPLKAPPPRSPSTVQHLADDITIDAAVTKI